MSRNVTALAEKATGHVVTPSAPLQAFLVTSKSGRTYTVTPFGESAVCSCEWGKRRGGVCSHILAVFRFVSSVPVVH